MELLRRLLLFHCLAICYAFSHPKRHHREQVRRSIEFSDVEDELNRNSKSLLSISRNRDNQNERFRSFSPTHQSIELQERNKLKKIKISGMMADSSFKQSIDIRPGISSEISALRNGSGNGAANSFWSLSYSPQFSFVSMNYTEQNVTTQVGAEAFLPCRIGKVSGPQVSWIRRRDWNVLTSGIDLYTHDKRFDVLHEKSSNDWILHIKNVSASDEGKYECQVPTGTGIISIFVNFVVVVPEAIIPDERVLVRRGSDISLKCVIHNTILALKEILWYHNGELLNFLGRKDTKISTNLPKLKSRQDIGKDLMSNNITSTLKIFSAGDRHAGNYTCSAPHIIGDYSLVYIAEEDKIAAVQRIHSGNRRTQDNFACTFFTFIFIFVHR